MLGGYKASLGHFSTWVDMKAIMWQNSLVSKISFLVELFKNIATY
jgi:hypothetical protein